MSSSQQQPKNAWKIGVSEKRQDCALYEGCVILGWHKMGDLSVHRTKSDLEQALRTAYPQYSDDVVSESADLLWSFVEEMQPQDPVLMPMDNGTLIALGRVRGGYEYRRDKPAGERHVRKVDWVRQELPLTRLLPGLHADVKSPRFVRRLSAADERHISRLLAYGQDSELDGLDSGAEKLLQDAAAKNRDRPKIVTVRTLLKSQGYERRTKIAVSVVESALAEHGLSTRPPFTEVDLDVEIELAPVDETADASESHMEPGTESHAAPAADFTLSLAPLGNLPKPLETVQITDTLQAATTKMIARDFSQLGVVDEEGVCRAAVSWESISRARIKQSGGANPVLRDALFEPEIIKHGMLTLETVQQMPEFSFFLVQNSAGDVNSIVTAGDLAGLLGSQMKPFAQIEEAEIRLRRAASVFERTELRSGVGSGQRSKIKQAANLTLGNYCSLLEDPDRWSKVGWEIDQAQLLEHLKQVVQVRNDLMHFSSDPMSSEQLDQIRDLLRLLRAADRAG